MASVGLPSILVWRGMQCRAGALPMLMQDACRDDTALAMHRVRSCLHTLAALACFVRATQFAGYCRECDQLLELYGQSAASRESLEPLLLRAAVLASQSLASPLRCLIDSGKVNELRQARRNASVSLSHLRYELPNLKELLLKRLRRVHYTLEDGLKTSGQNSVPVPLNSFRNLNRVAALCLGGVFLEKVPQAENYQQTGMQILRLELHCRTQCEGRPSPTLTAMQALFLASSTLQALRGLRTEMRALMQQAEKQGRMELERSLWAFYKVSACCVLLNSAQARVLAKLSTSAQRLVMHLRCWEGKHCDASVLMCLCVLALERQLDIEIAVRQERRPCERADKRLQRRIQHFIRTQRRKYRTTYAVPITAARVSAYQELRSIHRGIRKSLALNKHAELVLPVEDGFLHALIRFKAIALYMGEMSLYEVLWNFRELVVLAIERKVRLTKILIALLPRLSAFGLRSFQPGRKALEYEARLITSLSEELLAQRQIVLSKIKLQDNKINLPMGQGQGRSKKQGQHSISTSQLPRFLAKNIRILITDPVAIYACQSTKEFGALSRMVILELTLLARGARALQVDRVAALSEVLLEIYRTLSALPALPEQSVLKRNLQWAHHCLRIALNQAAGRQKVCDVRPTIVSLYHFLECLHRPPADSPDSLQSTLTAVNTLAADMRAFADVFACALKKERGGRFALASEQLHGLMAATRRLQEDLTATDMISIARWGPPLLVAVGRFSNAQGKSARLDLFLDEVEATRGLVEQLRAPLQTLLCLMIEHSVEEVARRRACGKTDSARLSLRATRESTVLTVSVTDDGVGLSPAQLINVEEEIVALGGSLTLASGSPRGSLVIVTISCATVRWDIASKSL